ncbi:G kinase-anchoring protein 1-like [Tubulanus polymorphus]|uniref:G kinase-anchoring protein 1-like n=1 Tax=Tubulanus polymorphus TaxID=672921 RepID=UPI003DA486F1
MANIACASRFALLKIEDDGDKDDVKNIRLKKKATGSAGADKTKTTQQQMSASAKKRQKRKNKKEQQSQNVEGDEFGGTKERNHNDNAKTKAQWEQWKKLDSEYTDDAYERDLQQALLLSKIEVEQKQQTLETATAENNHQPEVKDKKKKKKDKSMTLSLDQFNQLDSVDEAGHHQSGRARTQSSSDEQHGAKIVQSDDKFFDNVEKDVSKIILKEKIQEEYTKQYIAENARAAHYEKELTKKDKEIEFLRATVSKLEDELKQVKKRNKQLCVILAQGEMRDKAEVLMQVDELTQVKDELTEQVGLLTADLEKERSKVHGLKTELDKYKSSGGHGHSHSGKHHK